MLTLRHAVSFLAGISAMACISIVLAAIDIAALGTFVKTTQTHFEGLTLSLIVASIVALGLMPKTFLSRSAHVFAIGLGAVAHIFLFLFLSGSTVEYGAEIVITLLAMNTLYIFHCTQEKDTVNKSEKYEASYLSARNVVSYVLLCGMFTAVFLSLQSIIAPNVDATILWGVLILIAVIVVIDVFLFAACNIWVSDLLVLAYLTVLSSAVTFVVDYVLVVVLKDSRSPIFLTIGMALALLIWVFASENWHKITRSNSKKNKAASN